jgi:hypothetical protein
MLRRTCGRAPPKGVAPRSVTVRARTPVRLERDGEFCSAPAFSDWVRASARRLAAIQAYWSDIVPNVHVEQLAKLASGVTVGSVDWLRFETTRYSSRQRRHHPLEGILGTATYSGPVGPFVPLLVAASRYGVGKGIALGLGQLEVDVGGAAD